MPNCLGILLLLSGALSALPAFAEATPAGGGVAVDAPTAPRSLPAHPAVAPKEAWPVETSLKTTLVHWARRQGWPAPRFLTEADWPVDVPGTISGSIEDALKSLAEGFAKAPSRPRIEVTANHVLLVSEAGAE